MQSSFHSVLRAVPFALAFCTVAQVGNCFETQNLGQYCFDLVAKSGVEISYVGSSAISDTGAIAYNASRENGSSVIYFSDGGPTQARITSGHPYAGGYLNKIAFGIDMNNNHEIAFSTIFDQWDESSVGGVFTIKPDGTITAILENNPTSYFFSLGVSINDLGDVAYHRNAPSYQDLYLRTGDGHSLVFNGSDNNRLPYLGAMNNNGQLAIAGAGNSPEQIYVYDNGVLTRIDETPPGLTNHMGAPGLNEKGEIAYVRQKGQELYDLVLFKDGQPSVLPVNGALDSRVELNDAGSLCFYGKGSDGRNGFRLYQDGAVTDVLSLGDTVFSNTIKYLNLHDMNERGQMALWVQFVDDSTAILLATPIPEPNSLALAAIAISHFGLARARKAW